MAEVINFNNGESLFIMEHYPYHLVVQSPFHLEPLVMHAKLNFQPEGIVPRLVLVSQGQSTLLPDTPCWVYHHPSLPGGNGMQYQAPNFQNHGPVGPASYIGPQPFFVQQNHAMMLENGCFAPNPPSTSGYVYQQYSYYNQFGQDFNMDNPQMNGMNYNNGMGPFSINCNIPTYIQRTDPADSEYTTVRTPATQIIRTNMPDSFNSSSSSDSIHPLPQDGQVFPIPPAFEPESEVKSTELSSGPPDEDLNLVGLIRKQRVCKFCVLNGYPKPIYQSHFMKTKDGKIITCRYLRSMTCPICRATGDTAHTARFCPRNENGLKFCQESDNFIADEDQHNEAGLITYEQILKRVGDATSLAEVRVRVGETVIIDDDDDDDEKNPAQCKIN